MTLNTVKYTTLCVLVAFMTVVHTPQPAEAHSNRFGWGLAAGIATGLILSEAYRAPRYYTPPYAGWRYSYGGYPSYYRSGYPYYGGYYDRPYRYSSYHGYYGRPHYDPPHHGYGGRPISYHHHHR